MKQIGFSLVIAVMVILEAQPALARSPKSIQARAFIVMDDHDSVLYAKNPSAKLPPASTVKLMTAMVALDLLEPWAPVIVSGHAAAVRSVKPRLRENDVLTVWDLLHLALMKSVNSAAVSLAEAAAGSEEEFTLLMNRKAQEIGAVNTHFANASGLPQGIQYTTARDLTVILKKALTYPLIREIIGTKACLLRTASGRQLRLQNTDNLLWRTSNMVGGKTGFTNNARHCFVGAMDTDKGMIFTAVLGAPSRNRLWKSTLMLADFGTNTRLVSEATTFSDILMRRPQRYAMSGTAFRAPLQIFPKHLSSLRDPIAFSSQAFPAVQ